MCSNRPPLRACTKALARKGSLHRHWMLMILKDRIKSPPVVHKVQGFDQDAIKAVPPRINGPISRAYFIEGTEPPSIRGEAWICAARIVVPEVQPTGRLFGFLFGNGGPHLRDGSPRSRWWLNPLPQPFELLDVLGRRQFSADPLIDGAGEIHHQNRTSRIARKTALDHVRRD